MSPEQVNKLSKKEILYQRAQGLRAARKFFEERGVMEVDVPALYPSACLDVHIDPVEVSAMGRPCFLHTSPEYGMKRLLVQGVGDIYQLSHVFRDHEQGGRHLPEFTMVEWYRHCSFQELMDETVAFAKEIIQKEGNVSQWTYEKALKEFAGLEKVEREEMKKILSEHVEFDENLSDEELLDLVMGVCVEPALTKEDFVLITHYPADQAALAKRVIQEGKEVALRFELYFRGLELANGYDELQNSQEQKMRFEEANSQREQMGKKRLPIDEPFLACLDHLPDVCGVAVGFDRLMMLRLGLSIEEVVPLYFNQENFDSKKRQKCVV